MLLSFFHSNCLKSLFYQSYFGNGPGRIQPFLLSHGRVLHVVVSPVGSWLGADDAATSISHIHPEDFKPIIPGGALVTFETLLLTKLV
jgi:hypothetical protein